MSRGSKITLVVDALQTSRVVRLVSCTETPDAEPQTFFELELGLVRVYEAVFALRMLAPKLAIFLHRGSAIRAGLDHCNAVEHAMVVFAVRLERFDHQPL